MKLSDDAILAMAAEWVWIPHDAELATDGDSRLVLWRGSATVLAAQASEDETPQQLVDRIVAFATSCKAQYLQWAIRPRTRPHGLSAAFETYDANITEQLDISYLNMTAGTPALSVPRDVDVVRIDSAETLNEIYTVDFEVFGFAMPDAQFRRDDIALAREQVALGDQRSEFRYLARLDGVTIGSAGTTLDSGVAKLWGGAVLEAYRGRGVYRALLAARLAEATAYGATAALVKARIGTSGPILQRNGFETHGRETIYRIELAQG